MGCICWWLWCRHETATALPPASIGSPCAEVFGALRRTLQPVHRRRGRRRRHAEFGRTGLDRPAPNPKATAGGEKRSCVWVEWGDGDGLECLVGNVFFHGFFLFFTLNFKGPTTPSSDMDMRKGLLEQRKAHPQRIAFPQLDNGYQNIPKIRPVQHFLNRTLCWFVRIYSSI